jgi:cytochrome c-type biogenesis protein CcsB
MESSLFFGISTVAYVLAMVLYITYIAFKKSSIGMAATTTTLIGFVSQTLAILMRWKEFYDMSGMGIIRSAPLTNLYESLVFFVWCLILGYLVVEFRYKNRFFGAFVTPIAALALAFIDISGMSKEIQPLVPALQSNWLLAHVLMSFIAYATFAISFSVGLMYLMSTTGRQQKRTGFWIVLAVFGIMFALISQSPQTVPLWIAGFALVIAMDIKLNFDITKGIFSKREGSQSILKTVLTAVGLSLVSIAALFIFIQLVKLQIIKADEAARLKHLGAEARAPLFKGGVMGMVGFMFFICLIMIKYLITKKEYYLFWTLSSSLFIIAFSAMGLDFLKFRMMGAIPPEGGGIIFRATFLSPSAVIAVASYAAAFALIYAIWRYGETIKGAIGRVNISPDTLEYITYKSITIGFPIFTLGGLVFGAIWADQAWGVYWSWDPKETWSLISWLVYAFFLHARLLRGWRGSKIAVVAVIGFVAVIFTYLGVNLLLSGLHAYGGVE